MKKVLAQALIALLLAGCASEKPSNDSDANRGLAKLTDDFIKGYLNWRPAMGTSLGLHEYDGRVTDVSSASINGEATPTNCGEWLNGSKKPALSNWSSSGASARNPNPGAAKRIGRPFLITRPSA